MFGFSEEDVEELAMQGIKPWDPEARAALNVLNGYDDYDDDYDEDDYDDDYDEDDYDEDMPLGRGDIAFVRKHWIGGAEKLDLEKQGEQALRLLDFDAARWRSQEAKVADTSAEGWAIAAEVGAARRAEAEAAKAEGNQLVARKEWIAARAKYCQARKMQPLDHVYHSNYAHTCLEMAKEGGSSDLAVLLVAAEDAASICIFLAPDWPKGYARMSAALLALAQPARARAVLEAGLARMKPAERPWFLEKIREMCACEAAQAELFTMACDVVPTNASLREAVQAVDSARERRFLRKLPSTSLSALFVQALKLSGTTPTPSVNWQHERAVCQAMEVQVLVCRLILARADVNTPARSGRASYDSAPGSALHWATANGNVEMIKWLLQAGATLELKSPSGNGSAKHNALALAVDKLERSTSSNEATVYAAAVYALLPHATAEHLNCWLIEDNSCSGSHIHASVLAKACDMLDVELVRALLAKGADPEFPRECKRGERVHHLPLHEALTCYGFQRDAKDEGKRARRMEVVKLLLDAGAQVTEKDLLGSCEADPAVRALLIERGASAAGVRRAVNWSVDRTTATLCDPHKKALAELAAELSLHTLVLETSELDDKELATLRGHSFERVQKLQFGCIRPASCHGPDNEQAAVTVLGCFPGLHTLHATGGYDHEWFSGGVLMKLGSLCARLQTLAVDGDNEGPEGSRCVFVTDEELTKSVSSLIAMEDLRIGAVGGWNERQHCSEYGTGDGSMDWTAGSTQLSAACLPAVLALPALRRLCLNSYAVDEAHETGVKAVPAQLELPASNLQHLALRLLLSDQHVACVARHAPNLLSVALHSPLISSAGIGAFAACARLQSFQLGGTRRPSDVGIQKLAQCVQLTTVRIDTTRKLTDASIVALAAAGQLHTLHLTGSRQGFATAAALSALATQCSGLQSLSLKGQRRMSAAAVAALSNLNLHTLILGCDFQPAEMPQIGTVLENGFASLVSWVRAPDC